MTVRITSMTDAEASRVAAADDEAGLGALRTERGPLPLDRIDVRAEITGLTSRVELTQDFVNTFDVPLEATYVFPLPDRGAVTRMQMTPRGGSSRRSCASGKPPGWYTTRRSPRAGGPPSPRRSGRTF